MTSIPPTLTGDDSPVNIHALTPRERNRLRLLTQRYRIRQDTTLRPLADVLLDLRSRHGIRFSMSGQVIRSLNSRAGQ